MSEVTLCGRQSVRTQDYSCGRPSGIFIQNPSGKLFIILAESRSESGRKSLHNPAVWRAVSCAVEGRERVGY